MTHPNRSACRLVLALLPPLLAHGGCGPVTLGTLPATDFDMSSARPAPADASNPEPNPSDRADAGAPAGTWTLVFTTRDSLRAVWGSSRNDVFVAGELGAIFHSADGGKTWQAQQSGSNEALRGLWGSNGTTFAGGSNSTLLKTTNSGQTWVAVPLGTAAEVNAVWGTSAQDYYLAGSRILHTVDGGQRFVATMTAGGNLFALWGSGAGDVFAGGQGVGGEAELVHSQDQGATWLPQQVGAQTFALFGIWGSGSDNVFAVGWSFTPIQTRNGGANWSRVGAPPMTYRSVWGAGAMDVYLGTAGSQQIHHTTDGGASWQMEWKIDLGQDVSAIWGSGRDDVYAVTMDGTVLHRTP